MECITCYATYIKKNSSKIRRPVGINIGWLHESVEKVIPKKVAITTK